MILDEAFSAPVLAASGAGVTLQARDAVLLEPRLLLLLMQAWRHFDTDEVHIQCLIDKLILSFT